MMTRLALAAIRSYQSCISPFLAPACRFYPTCSDYSAQAIATFGLWRGVRLAVARIFRCHPLHPGGYDPVPECECAADPSSMGKVS